MARHAFEKLFEARNAHWIDVDTDAAREYYAGGSSRLRDRFAEETADAARRVAPGVAFAVGDVHGDLGATLEALRTTGLVEVAWDGRRWRVRWRARDDRAPVAVVFCGDVVDRRRGDANPPGEHPSGLDEFGILMVLNLLSIQAWSHDDVLVRAYGNHEIGLVDPAYRADYGSDLARAYYAREFGVERKAFFARGGWGAREIGGYGTRAVVRFGGAVFMHAGIGESPKVDAFRRELGAESPEDGVNRRVHAFVHAAEESPDAAAWQRTLHFLLNRTQGARPVACDALHRQLVAFGDRPSVCLVLGHCVHLAHADRSLCADGAVKLYRVDCALSRGFDEVLQRTRALRRLAGAPAADACRRLCDEHRVLVLRVDCATGVGRFLRGGCLERAGCPATRPARAEEAR